MGHLSSYWGVYPLQTSLGLSHLIVRTVRLLLHIYQAVLKVMSLNQHYLGNVNCQSPPHLQNQKFWGWGSATCDLTSPPGDSEAPLLKFEDHWHGDNFGSTRSPPSSGVPSCLKGLGHPQAVGPEARDSNRPAPVDEQHPNCTIAAKIRQVGRPGATDSGLARRHDSRETPL